MSGYYFNVLYYADIYKKWWKKIILLMLVSMSLTMCFSLFQPVSYISTVTLLLTGRGSSENALGRFLGLSGLSTDSPIDLVFPLLNSRRMSEDIRKEFKLDEKSNFQYRISSHEITGALLINVTGSDPVLTEKIANFVVSNLDKINMELDITPNKPMVKVLDPAVRGSQLPKHNKRRILVSGILAFMLISLYIFSSDYIKKLKSH